MKRHLKSAAQLLLIWIAIAATLVVAAVAWALIDTAPFITHIGRFSA